MGENTIYSLYLTKIQKISVFIIILIMNSSIISQTINLNTETSKPKCQYGIIESGSYLKYSGTSCYIYNMEGGNIGFKNNIEINYFFKSNSSGKFMENQILIKDSSSNDLIYSKSINFIIVYENSSLYFENNTFFGKTHLFLSPNNLTQHNKEILLASYNGNNVYGSVEYHENFGRWICNDQLYVKYSGFRVLFQEDNENHLMLFETKSGVLIEFNPNFLNLDIFKLFGISWAGGNRIILDETDFEFQTLEISSSENNNPTNNFAFSPEIFILIGGAGLFIGLFYLVTKKRNNISTKKYKKKKRKR